MAELPKIPQNSEYDPYPQPASEADLESVRKKESLSYAQDEEHRRALYSRRSFLRTAGKVGVYSAFVAAGGMEVLRIDTSYGETLHHGNEMKLEQIAAAHKGKEHAATIFLPGFNVISSVPAAQALASVAAEQGNVTGFTHAASRFSIDTLEAHIRAYISENGITSVTLLGSSLGGLMAVDLAGKIKEVDMVIADSSPADPSDARQLPQHFMKSVTEGASWALDTLQLSGGPGTRTVTEFVKRLHDGDKSAIACLKEALSLDYASSCSNALALDLYLFLLTHNIEANTGRLGSVDMAYMGTNDPRKDIVVDQESSANKYARLAREQGNFFVKVTSRDTAHTDIESHPDAYKKMYTDLQAKLATHRKLKKLESQQSLMVRHPI
ncbi:MAG TPA: alpha/beta hydrolase [Candidatus Saccharimonadales bacterium]|nr:alpha/beta hydrolase [Candidatus Saccharimonadales bacterium]